MFFGCKFEFRKFFSFPEDNFYSRGDIQTTTGLKEKIYKRSFAEGILIHFQHLLDTTVFD